MTEFNRETSTKNNTALSLFQYPDVSDVVLNIKTPQRDWGILIIGSALLTYRDSKCNDAYVGKLLNSAEWC
jgi:hypothetical protein